MTPTAGRYRNRKKQARRGADSAKFDLPDSYCEKALVKQNEYDKSRSRFMRLRLCFGGDNRRGSRCAPLVGKPTANNRLHFRI